uniref:Uncharacterized protein n=1 Tax=Oscillatoriales cyanobacterium SpSt-402 TaxID=2282168 RepID=A0A832H4M6_9CYAN
MNFEHNHKSTTSLIGAIAASAFLGVAIVFPQAAFSQTQNPGTSGDPRIDHPGTNNRVDDPSRPLNNSNDANTPANTTPSGNVNQSTGVGGGAGGSGVEGQMNNRTNTSDQQPDNRIERYTQPNSTEPGRSNDTNNPSSYTTPGSRGNDRYTSPTQNTPGRGTYSSPRGQVNSPSGVGGGAGGSGTVDSQTSPTSPGTVQPDNRIERYTQPGSTTPNTTTTPDTNRSTTPDSGSGNFGTEGSNTGGGAGGTGTVPGLW